MVLEPAGRRALERGEARGTLGKVLWSLGRAPLPESALRKRFPTAYGILERLERIGWIRRELATEPPSVRVRTQKVYRLARGIDLMSVRETHARAARRLEILDLLAESPRPLPATAAAATALPG